MGSLRKSDGITDSERRLAAFCEQTFLALWSYPSLYRDQKVKKRRSGKQLCDLLVVCGSDVVLFSDKACAFPTTGDLHTDWSRWFKRSVIESAQQLRGAERWIRNYPGRIFLDESCTEPFPFIREGIELRIHRVVVARGSGERNQAERGGLGTLAIDPDIEGPAHVQRAHPAHRPFSVGNISPGETFVHVFDEHSLELILSELDTIGDFLAYLRIRERLVVTKELSWSPGEEDLLAVYIAHTDGDGNHVVPAPEPGSRTWVQDGSFQHLYSRPEYKRKRSADEVSYVWDRIIDEFGRHVLEGTLEESSRITPSELEHGLRVMAIETRFSRRVLGHSIMNKIESTPADKIGVRTLRSPRSNEVAYLFILFPFASGSDEAQYVRARRDFLVDYCFVFSHRNRDVREIIGIATESGLDRDKRSHGLVYMKDPLWTPEAVELAEQISQARQIQIKDNIRETPGSFDEFPFD